MDFLLVLALYTVVQFPGRFYLGLVCSSSQSLSCCGPGKDPAFFSSVQIHEKTIADREFAGY